MYIHTCIFKRIYIHFFFMYSCACSLSSNAIDLCTVITCECSQNIGLTALMLASYGGHAETVRVLVELGASVEAVDKVNIHVHALAYTCCVKHVSGIMRMTMIIMSHEYKWRCIYMQSYIKHARIFFFVTIFFLPKVNILFSPLTCFLSPNTSLLRLY
jgi:hypothetical protein